MSAPERTFRLRGGGIPIFLRPFLLIFLLLPCRFAGADDVASPASLSLQLKTGEIALEGVIQELNGDVFRLEAQSFEIWGKQVRQLTPFKSKQVRFEAGAVQGDSDALQVGARVRVVGPDTGTGALLVARGVTLLSSSTLPLEPEPMVGIGSGSPDFSKSKTSVSQQQYQAVADLMDNPQEIFDKANYIPLWTASPEQAKGRLPKGCTVVPAKARLWEPWFRNTLKNNGQVLSTAEVLMIRDNVCMAVAKGPTTQFRPPQKMAAVAASIEKVRKEALTEFGVTNPSSVLSQVTMADAAWAWATSQRKYGDEMINLYVVKQDRWPTADEYTGKNESLTCIMSAVLMIRLLRTMDAVNSNSGIKIGGITGRNYHKGPNMMGHAICGVAFDIGKGETATSYYDPTPDQSLFAQKNALIAIAG